MRFPKICAWCGIGFAAKHPRHLSCSPSCSNRLARARSRKRWPAYYTDNQARLADYHSRYYSQNREACIRRSCEYHRRRKASMTEAERAAYLERRRDYDRKRRAMRVLIRKVSKEWGVGPGAARAMIERGSFPP